jgi:hypothetical protein
MFARRASPAGFGAPSPVPVPPSIVKDSGRDRLPSALFDRVASTHRSFALAAAVALLALLYSVFAFHVSPAFLGPVTAAQLQRVDVLGSALLALAFVTASAVALRRGMLRRSRGTAAFLLLCGAAFVGVVVLQARGAVGGDLAVASKTAMGLPFAALLFALTAAGGRGAGEGDRQAGRT